MWLNCDRRAVVGQRRHPDGNVGTLTTICDRACVTLRHPATPGDTRPATPEEAPDGPVFAWTRARPPMTVAGLLLAAGAGRRFGRPKALVEWDGAPLVVQGLKTLTAGGAEPALAVLGAEAEQVRTAATGLRDDQVVVAGGWAEGVGASLRAGLAALAESTAADAVVIVLVDQPLVRSEAVSRLVRAVDVTDPDSSADTNPNSSPATSPRTNADAAVATYGGRQGHPVGLRRAVWHEVAALAVGEIGARAWLNAHAGRVHEVGCDGLGLPADIDTPADLARLESWWANQRA